MAFDRQIYESAETRRVFASVFLLVCATLAIVTLSFGCASKRGLATSAKFQLSKLAYWFAEYAKEHQGQLPPNLDDLATFAGPKQVDACRHFRNPINQKVDPWLYFPHLHADQAEKRVLVAMPMSVESESLGRCRAVLYTDLQTEIVSEDRFSKMTDIREKP